MIILEAPFISLEMAEYLVQSRHPVLDNAVARSAPLADRLNLLPDAEFARRVNTGERLYTTSENALDWVRRNVTDENILRGVDCMKDKAKLRQALASIYPDYFFREIAVDELSGVDPDLLPLPVVLKPVVGFFSVGVYVAATPDAWRAAVADILAKRETWRRRFPDAVVGAERFIIEQYITGEEFAIDAYFDDRGDPVILNIMKHDFSAADDVSDRLYYTSLPIISAHHERFTIYLKRVNEILRLRNFPFHLELRLDGKNINAIEFNPLRFAGWCCTDLAWFAYDIRTYEYYLKNNNPAVSNDWAARVESSSLIAANNGGEPANADDIFSMVILDKPKNLPEGKRFDFAAARADFTEVVHERPVTFPDSPIFGFLFTRTSADRREELDRIMRSDLTEYLTD